MDDNINNFIFYLYYKFVPVQNIYTMTNGMNVNETKNDMRHMRKQTTQRWRFYRNLTVFISTFVLDNDDDGDVSVLNV